MLSKKLTWKLGFIALVVLFALLASYPLQEKTVRVEEVTEKYEYGQWVEGAKKVVKRSLLASLMAARDERVSVEREYEQAGAKYRVKRVEHVVPGKIKLGLDLRGGAELLYRVRVSPEDERPNIVGDVISILEKRIDPQGVLEYRLQQQGTHRVLIQVPGATKDEIERLKKRIVTMGKLEFRLCETDPAMIQAMREGKPTPGCYSQYVGLRRGATPDASQPEPRCHLVQNRVQLTGEYLADVYPTYNQMEAVVGFKMNPRGAKIFARLTDRNRGAPLAIILDDKLVSAPIIEERIAGSGIIRGSFTQTQVNDLVATLRAGSLPADLELVMGNSVGPSLGSDSIRQGIRAIVVGSLLVLAFVAAYYLWVGCVADFALLLNLVLVIGALSLFQATLTLPGIAGLVLTVGMAIDANVLIFERIREEKEKAGKTIKTAIATGYQRAFLTILDANITTLITAVILYIVGTGPVKGFAVTLSSGIIFSMFTALFVTRTIFAVGLERGWVTEMRMRQFFRKPKISFTAYRKPAAAVSAVLIAIGLITFLVRGRDNYDIDFTGGTLVQLRLAEATPVGEVKDKLETAGYAAVTVQSMWEGGKAKATAAHDFGIRIQELSAAQSQAKIKSDWTAAFGQKPGLVKLDFSDPSHARLALATAAEEDRVVQLLAEARYTGEDVPALVARGVKAERFSVSWGLLKEKEEVKGKGKGKGEPKQEQEENPRLTILRFLKAYALMRDVKLNFGDKVELAKVDLAERTALQESQLTLDLSHAVDVLLLKEIVAKTHPKVRLYSRGAERKRDIGRRYMLSGSRADLEAVKAAVPKTLKAPAATFVEKHRLEVTLASAMAEAELRATVLAQAPHAAQVRRVMPLGVAVQEFDVELSDLRGEKVQEKIRDDIAAAFAGNLYRADVGVEFGPEEQVSTAAPAAATTTAQAATVTAAATASAATATAAATTTASAATTTPAAVEFLVKLTLGKKIPLWRIKSALAEAGAGDALMPGHTPGQYREVRVKAASVAAPAVRKKIAETLATEDPFRRVVSIGGAVAGEMKNRAILAMLFAMFAIVVYIWMRFGEIKFGIAAVIALLHDVLIAIGAVAVAGWVGGTAVGHWAVGDIKINLPLVAAFLTIVGYSLNDTIVIFVRIRENMGGHRRGVTAEILDESINQTLSRTLLTSLTTLAVVMALYLLGGGVIHGFAFALMVGVVVGTYSSVFIASPVLLEWDAVVQVAGWVAWLVTMPVRLPFMLLRLASGRKPS